MDEYNNSYNRSIGKKNPICPDYSALSEEFDSSHKTYKFEVFDRFRITKYKNNFSKD